MNQNLFSFFNNVYVRKYGVTYEVEWLIGRVLAIEVHPHKACLPALLLNFPTFNGQPKPTNPPYCSFDKNLQHSFSSVYS